MIKMSLRNLMMLVLSVSLVTGVVLTVGCVRERAAIIEDITPQEAFTLIQNNQNNPDFVIIDVRTLEEFAEGYIENAINIDFRSEAFQDTLNDLDKDKKYLIYCRSGGRSGNALNIMAELNFREVYNISGGIIAWNAEGLPTTK
jgi:rhodanese-related sulfurtransferase